MLNTLRPFFYLLIFSLVVACAQQPSVKTSSTEEPTTTESPSPVQETVAAVFEHEESQNIPEEHVADATGSSNNLWQKIGDAKQIKVPAHPQVQFYRNFYLNNRKFIAQSSERAEPFLYFLITELEQRQMPIELALLPMVESGFNPKAKAGAPVGYWQMVPQTANKFGLNRNQWLDERKDPIKSTLAALDYLQYLYQLMGNDWFLAVAAYNSGEGRIQAAVTRNQKRGKPVDFWSLNLPAKSTSTLPKWLALIELLQQKQQYPLPWFIIANEPRFSITPLKGPVRLQQIADLADISIKELSLLNPALNREIVPAGQQQIVLPLQASEIFRQKQHLLTTVKLTSHTDYVVKSGDSLSKIASRHQMTVQQLKQLNGLKNDQLAIGQVLRLNASDNPQTTTAKSATTSKPNQIYVVEKGDVLSRIAKKHKIKLADLLQWNGISADTPIKPGHRLKVSAPSPTHKGKKR